MTAVAYILVRGGELLVEERQEGRFKGQWLFPTEKIEPGETEEETLARGLMEELGVEPLSAYSLGNLMNDWGYMAFVWMVLSWTPQEVPDRILDSKTGNRVEWKPMHEMLASPHKAQREMARRLMSVMVNDGKGSLP